MVGGGAGERRIPGLATSQRSGKAQFQQDRPGEYPAVRAGQPSAKHAPAWLRLPACALRGNVPALPGPLCKQCRVLGVVGQDKPAGQPRKGGYAARRAIVQEQEREEEKKKAEAQILAALHA